MNEELLPLIWASFLGLSVALYVVLDGFSLGVGILFPFARDKRTKDTMMRTVLPVWDGNQTWLVGGGAALFAAFPIAFHTLLTALYLPLMVMLLALVLRGAALEFRFKTDNRRPWDIAFAGGAITAAFCQGLVLAAYVQGFGEVAEASAIDGLTLITPFGVFCGISVVTAYAMIGACWLRLKTSGGTRSWASAVITKLVPVVAVSVIAVSLWTPWLVPAIAERWFVWPNIAILSPIPIWTGGLLLALFVTARNLDTADVVPFLLALGVFLLTLTGLAVSIWPYVIPRSLTIWEAAAPANSLMFVLVGVLFVVPVILLYTAHAYYVFRGKVGDNEPGY